MGEVDRDIGALAARMDILETRMSGVEDKLGQLLSAAAMGRGAWWLLLRLGGLLVLLASGAAWIWDRRP